ncbi:MAG: caspase family protein [Rhizobiaceae bacterium]
MHSIGLRLTTIVAALVLTAVAIASSRAAIAIVSRDGNPISNEAQWAANLSRQALVIGVSNYRYTSVIKNAARDADLVSETLRDLGFDVTTVLNPGIRSLKSAFEDYADRLSQEGEVVSVVYYAGHGASLNGENYVFPTDQKIESGNPEKFKADSLSISDASAKIKAAMTGGLSFLFIDTSRTNPFPKPGSRGSHGPLSGDTDPGTGLASVGNDAQTAILFAATEGGEAMDGEGSNGPFAVALVKWLKHANIGHEELMRNVRNDVIKATGGAQIPHSIDELTVSFVFNAVGELDELTNVDPETRAARVLYEQSDGRLAATYEDGSYALLIGVGDYSGASSDKARPAWADLVHVEDELTRLGTVLSTVHGFEVETVFDPTSDELEASLETFVNLHGPKPNARLLVMLSGHGTTTEKFGRKTAWFIPVDAPGLEPRGPFTAKALSLRRIEEWSEIIESKHVMWIFDSCFSGAAIRMIESKSSKEPDGWAEHLHRNPVRRVLTAGSENEEVPAKSRFTETLIRVLSGQETIDEAGDFITGDQLGTYLKRDVIRYNYKQDLPKNTPQSDTIVIEGEEGDVMFAIDPALSAKWIAETAQ